MAAGVLGRGGRRSYRVRRRSLRLPGVLRLPCIIITGVVPPLVRLRRSLSLRRRGVGGEGTPARHLVLQPLRRRRRIERGVRCVRRDDAALRARWDDSVSRYRRVDAPRLF